MSEYVNIGDGTLSRNNNKKSEKSPDYYGKLTIDGREIRLAGWIREGKYGKFLSIQASEERAAGFGCTSGPDIGDLGDDVPF